MLFRSIHRGIEPDCLRYPGRPLEIISLVVPPAGVLRGIPAGDIGTPRRTKAERSGRTGTGRQNAGAGQ